MNKPRFSFGDEVRVVRTVRNDGTYPGLQKGDQLVRRGSIGYVREWGLYLQEHVVYQVHFPAEGRVVGCRESELIAAEVFWDAGLFQYGDQVEVNATLTLKGQVVAAPGAVGKITAAGQGLQGESFTVQFGDRFLQVPARLLRQVEAG